MVRCQRSDGDGSSMVVKEMAMGVNGLKGFRWGCEGVGAELGRLGTLIIEVPLPGNMKNHGKGSWIMRMTMQSMFNSS